MNAMIANGRRLFALLLALLALAGCSLRPGELAMRQAIGTYVGAAENYPMAYVEARGFQFRDLQRVPGQAGVHRW